MSYDLSFRTGGFLLPYDTAGKSPYFYFADQESVSSGYVNNSLEGTLFTADPPASGTIVFGGNYVRPKWSFYDSNASVTTSPITALSIDAAGICTVTYDTSLIPMLAVGDVVSINGVGWDTTHSLVNGSWAVKSVTLAGAGSTFKFETDIYESLSYASLLGASPQASRGPAFSIYDNRAFADTKGQSFTSVLFTPKSIYDAAVAAPHYTRVLPSDLYTRFRIQSSSDVAPQGGINSNLFNVLATDGMTNIKPALWAYFFGYNSAVTPGSIFEIMFNSYAFVLRPSGDGSKLEFALLKFSWGNIADSAAWTAIITAAEDRYKSHTVLETDLGYLICTNPAATNTSTTVVTELAKSDSFTYNSEVTPRFNLKITIRKHLLSDSILDGTYLVNLMINDTYNDFGEKAHYDSILHAYIAKPDPVSNLTTGLYPHDAMLMPMMYFKYNNTNEDNVKTNASKIVQDSLFFRQINAVAGASYLY